jgi:hypothetical protein
VTTDAPQYRLEAGRAMRALMADDDTATETPAADEDGAITWLPLSPDAEDEPPFDYRQTGTYTAMAELAEKLNGKQDKMGQPRMWNFFPHPLEPQASAA